MKSLKQALCLAFVIAFSVPPGFAWGNEGHRWINRAAALSMPNDYPQFMREPLAIDEIEYLGPEPDRWRSVSEPSLKNAQEPDHFIDLELLEGFGPLPLKRYEFIEQLQQLWIVVRPNESGIKFKGKVGADQPRRLRS